MTQERYRLINSLADAALERPEAERASFLDEACKEDPALLAEVQQLLRAESGGSDFLQGGLMDQLARDMAANQDGNDLTGKQFQHYQILSWLGSGGLGEVWLAKDTSLGREVALKLLSRVSASDPLQIRRFQREARTASSLNHPNIVTIYEVGTAEAHEYIAQEVVRGQTLRQVLKTGPLPLGQVIELGKQVAAALAAAHAAKIVHRDIKPENIMLRPDGIVKVLDFGLARFVEGATTIGRGTSLSITRPGIVLGTAKYMSPEQARGLTVDARSDVFSLGAVLYEMATGLAPFDGHTTSDVMASILTEEPQPISKRVTRVPPEFTVLLRRCLQKDPAKRYADGQELKAALDSIPQKSAVAVRGKAHWIAIGVLAAFVVACALYFWPRQSGKEPSFASMRIRRVPVQGDVEDASISQNGESVAYVLRDGSGESIWLRELATSRERRLLASEPVRHKYLAFSMRGKYLVWLEPAPNGLSSLYRMQVAQPGTPAHLRDNLNSAVAFSPDGEWYAYFKIDPIGRRSALMVASVDGRIDRAIDVRDAPKYFSRYGLAWSPDSRYIACFAGDATHYTNDAFHLVKVRVTDGHEEQIGAKAWLLTGSMSWPTNGTIFASATEQIDDNYQVWDISVNQGTVTPVTNDLSNHGRISASSDARTMLTLQTQSTFEIWAGSWPDWQRLVQITSGDVRSFDSVAWMPDGRIVFSALGGESRNIWMMNDDGSNPRQITYGPGNKREVAVTPDGRYILYHAGGTIWRIKPDGSDAREITHGRDDVHPEPDGNNGVLYGSFREWSPGMGGKPTLWRVSIDGSAPALLSPIAASAPKLSPDRRWIACEYFPGTDPQLSADDVAILPARGGEPVRIVKSLPQGRSFVSWAPEGDALEWSASQDGVHYLWRLPFTGAIPREVLHLQGNLIAGFAWSRDGRKLAIARSNVSHDIVLIRAM